MGGNCSCDNTVEPDFDSVPQKRRGEIDSRRISLKSPESDAIVEPLTAYDTPTLDDELSDALSAELSLDQKTKELLMKIEDTLVPHMDDENTVVEKNDDDDYDDFLQNKPTIHRVTTDDRDIAPENDRLSTIYNVSTFDELQDIIGKNYDTDGESESDHSDLEESDKLEIEERRRGSIEKPKENQLQDTFEEMHEMKQQLLDLTKQASDAEISSLHESNQLSQELFFVLGTDGMDSMEPEKNDELELPESNLFRGPSGEKWSKPQIEKTKKEMERQMVMLASQNRTFDH